MLGLPGHFLGLAPGLANVSGADGKFPATETAAAGENPADARRGQGQDAPAAASRCEREGPGSVAPALVSSLSPGCPLRWPLAASLCPAPPFPCQPRPAPSLPCKALLPPVAFASPPPGTALPVGRSRAGAPFQTLRPSPSGSSPGLTFPGPIHVAPVLGPSLLTFPRPSPALVSLLSRLSSLSTCSRVTLWLGLNGQVQFLEQSFESL